MPICTGPCGLDRPLRDFRVKTSGPLAGFRFPKCIPDEHADALEDKANELRAEGYTATKAPSGDTKTQQPGGK